MGLDERLMDWLFVEDYAHWPTHLIYVLESAFIFGGIAAFLAAGAIGKSRSSLRSLIVGAGVLIGAIAISFPILLAPLFFSVAENG
jgi:hypothetical protein